MGANHRTSAWLDADVLAFDDAEIAVLNYEPQYGLAFHSLAVEAAENHVEIFEGQLYTKAVELARSQQMTEVQKVQVDEANRLIGPGAKPRSRKQGLGKAAMNIIATSILGLMLGQTGIQVTPQFAVFAIGGLSLIGFVIYLTLLSE